MSGEDPIIAGMAGRYATALFELAQESGKVKQVEKDLETFGAMLAQSDDLQRLVRSPVFSAEEQQRALAAILAKAGIKGLTANFLALVARNRRLFAVSDMLRAFRALLARHRGEVTAEVVSATKLSAAQVKALKAELKAAIGQNIQMTTQVDPALLGGLVVKIGSRMIDTSLRTKLNNLKFAMKEVG
ncbi:MAG: F0F1 ATP synthase subunit delta [Methyloligellaceae bacterium]